MDLNSHHGTHVLKHGQTVSTAINPEHPVVLADGDVVTFGKTVGSDEQTVKPVTVRVELLHDASKSSPLPQINILDPLSEPTKERAEGSNWSESPRGSGRYGIYVPTSVSSDDGDKSSSKSSSSESDSEHDSDIEEIPPPNPPAASSGNSSHNSFGLPSITSLNLLRHLLPPAHNLSTPSLEFPSAPQVPLYYPSPPMLPPLDPTSQVDHHLNSIPSTSTPSSPVLDTQPKGRDGADEKESRSESPMDLSSQSPAPEEHCWLISRSPSPVSQPRITVKVREYVDGSFKDIVPPDAPAIGDATVTVTAPIAAVADTPDPGVLEKDAGAVSSKDIVSRNEGNGLELSLERIRVSMFFLLLHNSFLRTYTYFQAEVNKLKAHKRKYRSRFNQNARTIAERLRDLEERQTSLSDHVDNVMEDVQGQVDGLGDQIDDMTQAAIKDDALKISEWDGSAQTVKSLVNGKFFDHLYDLSDF
jgi:hypothetical protein